MGQPVGCVGQGGAGPVGLVLGQTGLPGATIERRQQGRDRRGQRGGVHQRGRGLRRSAGAMHRFAGGQGADAPEPVHQHPPGRAVAGLRQPGAQAEAVQGLRRDLGRRRRGGLVGPPGQGLAGPRQFGVDRARRGQDAVIGGQQHEVGQAPLQLDDQADGLGGLKVEGQHPLPGRPADLAQAGAQQAGVQGLLQGAGAAGAAADLLDAQAQPQPARIGAQEQPLALPTVELQAMGQAIQLDDLLDASADQRLGQFAGERRRAERVDVHRRPPSGRRPGEPEGDQAAPCVFLMLR